MRLSTGTCIGAFEIVAPIGAGGMGEVYEARDTRLGRRVALKVLPQSLAADSDRLMRLQREARLLASLNHTNIAAIYGFEDAGGIPALVLELVEGQTLADRIGGRALPLPEAITIAGQLAEALDAAHEAGIVHRDLKPANIKIRPDGTVKVLDFGLARAVQPLDMTQALTVTAGTQAGVVLGTPAYMSPEQARGEPADKRADIWAFGCVLYEMLTGRRAFDRRTMSDTLVAVLTGEPAWTELPADLPGRLRELIRRCLERDLKRRLRDIGDALPFLDTTGDAARRDEGEVRTRSGGVGRWAPWLVAAVSAAAALWMLVFDRHRDSAGRPPFTLEQLTYDAGLTTMPAPSPDGNFVAYASDRAGRGDLDIWVQGIGGATPLQLTDDVADDQAPDFSPDASQIVFRSERAGGGLYLVPALGGVARRIVPGGRDPKFSPDGTRIAYWTGAWRGAAVNLRSAVFVVSLNGGAPQPLLPDFRMARSPIWAPDGRSLMVLARRDDAVETFDWWLVPLDGAPPAQTGLFAAAGRPDTPVIHHAWTAAGLLFAPGGADIRSVPLSGNGAPEGPIRVLTTGTTEAAFPNADRSGRIVFSAVKTQRAIVRALIGPGSEGTPAIPLFSDDRQRQGRASASADGRLLVFEQWFPGHREIWLKDLQGGRQQMIVRVETTNPLNATLSPDGARVAYTIGGDGAPGTGYIVETTAGVPVKVCERCNLYGFRRDNQRVIAMWARDVIGALNPGDGIKSEMVRAKAGVMNRPHVSPDDRWIAFRHGPNIVDKTYVAPVVDGALAGESTWQKVDEPTGTGRPAGWSLDSRTLYLLLDTDGFRCLWGQRVDPDGRLIGKPSPVRHFHDVYDAVSTSYGNPITAEGFIYETVKRSGNLWRIK